MPTVRTGLSVFPRLQYRLLRPSSASSNLSASRILICRWSSGKCCQYSTTTTAATDSSTGAEAPSSDRHVAPPAIASEPNQRDTNNHAAPVVAPTPPSFRRCPFHFEAGYGLHAKRHSRPFPPPFLSRPSGSFSDPLSTHHGARDRRPKVNGELIRGVTNGDDAVLVSDNFICANDGVGAWATREKGHAALWSRLIIHFWAQEMETGAPCGEKAEGQDAQQEDALGLGPTGEEPNPVLYLSRAFEKTKQATSDPNEWFGTTTASGALLGSDSRGGGDAAPLPVLYVTQLGDSAVMVVRPSQQEIIYKTKEQWHWFDCPRQLGTNSPDTPETNAVMDRVEIEEDDIVLAMSDGVCDNLWDHEVMQNVVDSMHRWDNGEAQYIAKPLEDEETPAWHSDRMMYVAQELVKAARTIAEDPFAESPYMEKAIDEGLSIEGGKRDDISVVIGRCVRGK